MTCLSMFLTVLVVALAALLMLCLWDERTELCTEHIFS